MENTLLTVSKELGVIDLPMKIRAEFSRALMAEREGKSAEAQEHLEKAVLAESRDAAA